MSVEVVSVRLVGAVMRMGQFSKPASPLALKAS